MITLAAMCTGESVNREGREDPQSSRRCKGWIAMRYASNGGLVATIGVVLVLLVQTGFTEG